MGKKNYRKEWKWNKNLSDLFFLDVWKKKMNRIKLKSIIIVCLGVEWKRIKMNHYDNISITYGGTEITSTLVHWCDDWVAFGQKHLEWC